MTTVRRLKRDRKAHLGIGIAAREVGVRVAVDVGLIDRADTDVGIAPGLQIDTGARAHGVDVRQTVYIRAAIETTDIGVQLWDLEKNILHRRCDLIHARIRPDPRFERQANVESIDEVMAHSQPEDEVGFIECIAAAGGDDKVRAALAEGSCDGS